MKNKHRATLKRLILIYSILTVFFLARTNAQTTIESPGYVDSVKLNGSQTYSDHLKELKSVDRSSLTRIERKQLRKEIRQVHRQINENKQGGGLLIAVAPLVVVVALLIIFL